MAGVETHNLHPGLEKEATARRWRPLSNRQRSLAITITLLAVDALVLVAAFLLAYMLRFKILAYYASYSGLTYLLAALWGIPSFLVLFAASHLYHQNILFGGIKEYGRVFSAVSAGIMLMISVDFMYRGATQLSRGWLLINWVISVCLVILWRFAFRRLVYYARYKGHFLSPAVIVGSNAEGVALAEQLRNSKDSGLYLIGFIDDNLPVGTVVSNGYRVLGGYEALESAIANEEVQDVIIAHTALDRDELLLTFGMLSRLPEVNVRLSSGLYEIITTGITVKEMGSVSLFEVNKTRIGGLDASLKLLLDYGATLIMLMLALPIMGLIAILIKRESSGPVIHRRRVMGANGKQFDAYKFRTMHVDGEKFLEENPELRDEYQRNFKLKNDPRVTRFGGFLRKYSLDELPQLFNVLRGEMSLVGPRIISPPEMEKYGKWGMNLLTVKPGITGLWQVSGRSDISYEERVQMDMQYIRNWSFGLDLYLILMTIPVVIKKKGAY